MGRSLRTKCSTSLGGKKPALLFGLLQYISIVGIAALSSHPGVSVINFPSGGLAPETAVSAEQDRAYVARTPNPHSPRRSSAGGAYINPVTSSVNRVPTPNQGGLGNRAATPYFFSPVLQQNINIERVVVQRPSPLFHQRDVNQRSVSPILGIRASTTSAIRPRSLEVPVIAPPRSTAPPHSARTSLGNNASDPVHHAEEDDQSPLLTVAERGTMTDNSRRSRSNTATASSTRGGLPGTSMVSTSGDNVSFGRLPRPNPLILASNGRRQNRQTMSPGRYHVLARRGQQHQGIIQEHLQRNPSIDCVNNHVSAAVSTSGAYNSGAQHSSQNILPRNCDKLAELRECIRQILRAEQIPEPLAIRLAWHASGTHDRTKNQLQGEVPGGSNGATMRFEPESSDPGNKGLLILRRALSKVQLSFPELSLADIWVFAGTTAVEELSRMKIQIQPTFGRTDLADVGPNNADVPENGRLPSPACENPDDLRRFFHRVLENTNDAEIVALMGAHTVGRCHPHISGYSGTWTRNPSVFDNSYFQELIGNEWISTRSSINDAFIASCPRSQYEELGEKQYADQGTRTLMMLPIDLCLKADREFLKISERFAENQEDFFRTFARAFSKLVCAGVPFNDHCRGGCQAQERQAEINNGTSSTNSSCSFGTRSPPSIINIVEGSNTTGENTTENGGVHLDGTATSTILEEHQYHSNCINIPVIGNANGGAAESSPYRSTRPLPAGRSSGGGNRAGENQAGGSSSGRPVPRRGVCPVTQQQQAGGRMCPAMQQC